jgi:hypothetical protein
MRIQQTKQLIEGVVFRKSIIDNSKRELNEKLALNFSVFSYIKFDEVSMSVLFRDLLDVKGEHGQGDLFLNEFIKMLQSKLKIELPYNLDHNLYSVNTEVQTKRIENSLRKIDIVLSWGQLFAIGIENKPYDKDQPNQLSDYADHLETHYHDNYLLVYLSDWEPSSESISDEKMELLKEKNRFVRINFLDDLASWLQASREKTKALKIQFFIDDLILKIMEREGATKHADSEFVDFILSTQENLAAAFEVAHAMPSLKQQLALDWVNQFIKELTSRTERHFKFENKTESGRINLEIKDDSWGSNYCGLFDLDSSGLFYSLVCDENMLKSIEGNKFCSGLNFWTDKMGRKHKFRMHEYNFWFNDVQLLNQFNKSISASVTEIEKLIQLLDETEIDK